MSDFFLQTPARFKRAGAVKPFTVVLSSRLRVFWIAGRAYANGDVVRPDTANGFAFQANAAGQSGNTDPFQGLLVVTAGQQVVDGSITWTAIAPGSQGTDPIASVIWNITNNDGSLSVVNQSNTIEEASAAFAGGTAGQTYRIQCLATTASGDVWDINFDLQVDV